MDKHERNSGEEREAMVDANKRAMYEKLNKTFLKAGMKK